MVIPGRLRPCRKAARLKELPSLSVLQRRQVNARRDREGELSPTVASRRRQRVRLSRCSQAQLAGSKRRTLTGTLRAQAGKSGQARAYSAGIRQGQDCECVLERQCSLPHRSAQARRAGRAPGTFGKKKIF